MPELPEVESICNRLRFGFLDQPGILGQRIVGAQVLWQRTLAFPDPGSFHEQILNQNIQTITRRGKFLVFELSASLFLLIHLRMSGDLFVEYANCPVLKHYRLVLDFEQGKRLVFIDPRKFGRVWLTPNPQEVLAGLGPEPLDTSLDAHDFYQRLHGRRRQLKPLLLDQTFLAGLGNIYTDEALFLAKLHPKTLSDQVTREQAEGLFTSIQQVLKEGIRRNGSSIDWVYRGGDFQNYFNVYQRGGEACPRCGEKIARIVVGQRGTHFCPICQPDPGS